MVSMIVAYAYNRVIGRDGKTPWHIPDDLQYFKRITSDHTVVMGRKTFESIGHPLPQRRNIVLTRNKNFSASGVEVLHDKRAVLALGDIYVIGGEDIFRAFLDETTRLHITEIEQEIEGDTFFPEWDRAAFKLVSSWKGAVDEKHTLPHTFYVYERK